MSREPEGLWGVRQRQQAGRLERVVDVCAVAGAAIIHTVAARRSLPKRLVVKVIHVCGKRGANVRTMRSLILGIVTLVAIGVRHGGKGTAPASARV